MRLRPAGWNSCAYFQTGAAEFAGGTDVPPAEPTPLLGHAGRRLEGARMGDGRSKSGLKPHMAFIYG